MVAVPKKKNGSVRICVDLQHLNKSVLREVHPLQKVDDILAQLPGARLFSKLDDNSGFWQIPLEKKIASPDYIYYTSWAVLLPARASEQGNVIGSVSVYIYIYMYIYIYIYICHQKKIVIERTRDLNYLKFVATDFSLKTISPSAGENSGDLA